MVGLFAQSRSDRAEPGPAENQSSEILAPLEKAGWDFSAGYKGEFLRYARTRMVLPFQDWWIGVC